MTLSAVRGAMIATIPLNVKACGIIGKTNMKTGFTMMNKRRRHEKVCRRCKCEVEEEVDNKQKRKLI